MKLPVLTIRKAYFLAFLVCIGLLAYSIHLQYNVGIQPCALCVLQRMDLILVCIVFFIGSLFVFGRVGKIILGSSGLLFSALGIALSGRQVWLQHMPTSAPAESCGASLQYMINTLPFNEFLKKIFQGSVECTEVGWKLFYLSLAEWSLISFGVFFLFCLWQLNRKTLR